MALPTTSELIFSEQANHNFSKTLGDIKRHTLSIHNRLRSILQDAAFVDHVADVYQRPLVANERCGSWYLNPARKEGSAYFKSTDGHTGIWYFSTRRLNTHLLEIIGQNDGCIIVDSTRRGKRMPDALSKTIPIWCCVLNRVLFPAEADAHRLHVPPNVVSSTEHAQILSKIDEHVRSFLSLQLDVPALRKHISKPLRPIWITPDSRLAEDVGSFDGFHTVICCTSSRRVVGGEVSEGGYIQGSGDDTENWAHGLTPPVFWANADLLLSTRESELPQLIGDLMTATSHVAGDSSSMRSIPPTNSLCITTLSSLDSINLEDAHIVVKLLPQTQPVAEWRRSTRSLEVGIGQHKLGSRSLRDALPEIMTFITEIESVQHAVPPKLVIACENGKDHSAGVALAVLCLRYRDDGNLLPPTQHNVIDKLFIRQRLGWIMSFIPDANPSRATLQSVNSFLMERPR